MAQFGQPVAGPHVWRRAEFSQRADWTRALRTDEREELLSLSAEPGGSPVSIPSMPALERLGAWVRNELEHGGGVVRLRGFPLGATEETVECAFRTLAERIGTPVSQSPAGERVLSVADRSFGADDPRVRGPHTNRRLRFHTDRCDVIAFLCVRAAASGGDTHVLSSAALYNTLLERDADAVRELGGVFPYLRHTVDTANERAWTEVPVFTVHQGVFAGSLLRVLIDRADAAPEAPGLTEAQRRALDRLEEVAEDPESYASFRLEPGDVLWLNNWVTFHRRTAFEDHPDADRRRLLLRVWLSVPDSRELDPRFADHFGATGAGEVRGGMSTGEGSR